MTAQENLAAIAADPALQALRDAGDFQGVADALPPETVGRDYKGTSNGH